MESESAAPGTSAYSPADNTASFRPKKLPEATFSCSDRITGMEAESSGITIDNQEHF
jgi:hypothetical protein